MRAARLIIALSVAGLVGCAPEPMERAPVTVAAAPSPPTPFGWMPARPVGEPLKHATASRLIVRLGADEVDAAERLYGPPIAQGELSGWWLRPITPLPSGGWLFLSVSGALFGFVAPPGLVDDPGETALARAGRAWRLILRDARSAD